MQEPKIFMRICVIIDHIDPMYGVIKMPNFDGTGPLKRGRIVGRGLGPCKNGTNECRRHTQNADSLLNEESRAK
jgi:hypothetical protein